MSIDYSFDGNYNTSYSDEIVEQHFSQTERDKENSEIDMTSKQKKKKQNRLDLSPVKLSEKKYEKEQQKEISAGCRINVERICHQQEETENKKGRISVGVGQKKNDAKLLSLKIKKQSNTDNERNKKVDGNVDTAESDDVISKQKNKEREDTSEPITDPPTKKYNKERPKETEEEVPGSCSTSEQEDEIDAGLDYSFHEQFKNLQSDEEFQTDKYSPKKRVSVDVKSKKRNGAKKVVLKIKERLSNHSGASDEIEDEFLLEQKLRKLKYRNRLNGAQEKKLHELVVKLPWPVPALHWIETRVAVRPNEKQKKMIENLDVVVKTGTYSGAEDKQIVANWEEFCRVHDLPEDPKPFLNLVNPERQFLIPTSERVKFVRFLAHNLENRLLCSVYNRFKRIFQDEKIITGRFTPAEDKVIVEYIQSSSRRTPYSDLATLLNRNKLAIEKRARKLAQKANIGDGVLKWNKKKIEEFLTHFVEVTDVEEINDLKYREISTEEWHKMEALMKIPMVKLQNAWNYTIYNQIFVKKGVRTSQVKQNLIRILVERGEDDFKTINWNSVRIEMANEFDGFTAQKLCMMLQTVVNYHVPATKRRNLKACLKYLQGAVENGVIKGHKCKRIKVIDNRD